MARKSKLELTIERLNHVYGKRKRQFVPRDQVFSTSLESFTVHYHLQKNKWSYGSFIHKGDFAQLFLLIS